MDNKKKKQVSCRAFSKFVGQFIDRYNWGWINDDGDPSFRYTAGYISSVSYKSWIKLRTYFRSSQQNRTTCLKAHLKARDNGYDFVFYTNRIGSDIVMLCGDIDCKENGTYLDCLEAMLYIRERFHNNCYFEPSTSSAGIHFYIFIDFSTCNFNSFQRKQCNYLINQYGEALSMLINNEYNCIFDGFKGTYRTGWNMENRGTLGKLPCPVNQEDFNTLCNSQILTASDMKKRWNLLQELLSDTQFSIPITIMSRDFESHINNEGSKSTDAFTRSRHICQQYCRYYKRNHNKLPSFDEFREYYRQHPSATQEETTRAYHRLKKVYKYVISNFDDELCKSKPIYTTGDFIDCLKQEITSEQLEQMTKASSYRYKLSYEDIDAGLGYFYINLMSNKEKKEFSSKELTVPINDMSKWFAALKEKGLVKRGCDRSKVQAIKTILENIGYIECVDRFYSTDMKTSRRWSFTPKFPKYDKFAAYVGKDVIEKIRKNGQEYIECKKKVSQKQCSA